MQLYLDPDPDPWRYPNTNINTTLPVYIAQAVVLSVVFPLSFVGTVLNIVFICRRKTNFLVRRIVYMTVITTLQLGVLWLWSIPAFKPDESMFNFCDTVKLVYIIVVDSGLLLIIALLVCSIYFTLVTKLCGCFSTVQNHTVKTTFPIKLISTSAGGMIKVIICRVLVMCRVKLISIHIYASTLNTNPASNVITTNIYSNSKRDRSLQGRLLEKSILFICTNLQELDQSLLC